jgi:hypothetical protein
MHTHTHGQLRWGLTNSSDCGHTVWASREAIYPLLDQEKYVHVIASLGWSTSHMQIKKVKRTYTCPITSDSKWLVTDQGQTLPAKLKVGYHVMTFSA